MAFRCRATSATRPATINAGPPSPLKRTVLEINPREAKSKDSASHLSEADAESFRKNAKIPRVIFQHFKQVVVPTGMFKAVHSIHTANPEFDYQFFNDEEAREFMVDHMNKSVVRAWDALIPDAFRSDLFRYSYLHVKGGVWIDPDFVALRPLAHLLKEGDTFIASQEERGGANVVYNAFIAATPKHPIIAKLLDDVVGLISKRQYSYDAMAITGNQALTRAFVDTILEEPEGNKVYDKHGGVRLLKHHKNPGCAIGEVKWQGHYYFFSRYPTYKREMEWFENQGGYREFWKGKNVYESVQNMLKLPGLK